MKRKLVLALTGLAMIMPRDADAQRRDRGGDRARERDNRVDRLEPVRAPGRVYRARPTRDVRTRVVYTSRSRHPRYSVGHAWLRADVREFRFRDRAYYGRRVVLKQNDLRALLGRQAVNRVRNAARRAGIRGPMRGRWIGQRGGARILIVTVDGFDVAEFSDWNRDGFVDQVYLIGERRPRRTVSRW